MNNSLKKLTVVSLCMAALICGCASAGAGISDISRDNSSVEVTKATTTTEAVTTTTQTATQTTTTAQTTTVSTETTIETIPYVPTVDINAVKSEDGKRMGNQALVDVAKQQVGNEGGEPYWSWYGFDGRIEWCGCFIAWCLDKVGVTEPYFTRCHSGGVSWFVENKQWGDRDYPGPAPGDLIFFDWDLDNSADHVGFYIGSDDTYFYTVEGNSEDVCKLRQYPWGYKWLFGFGLMNWEEENLQTVKPLTSETPAASETEKPAETTTVSKTSQTAPKPDETAVISYDEAASAPAPSEN